MARWRTERSRVIKLGKCWYSETNPFQGRFYGNSHTITGLTVSGGSYAGFFGCTSGAEIWDVGLVDVNITGSYIALVLALKKIKKDGLLKEWPLTQQIAAISVGISEGKPVLDLNYHEDSKAEVDMNIVMVDSMNFVEVQGTAEGQAFSKKQMDAMLKLAEKGIKELFIIQNKALK